MQEFPGSLSGTAFGKAARGLLIQQAAQAGELGKDRAMGNPAFQVAEHSPADAAGPYQGDAQSQCIEWRVECSGGNDPGSGTHEGDRGE